MPGRSHGAATTPAARPRSGACEGTSEALGARRPCLRGAGQPIAATHEWARQPVGGSARGWPLPDPSWRRRVPETWEARWRGGLP
eukprot:245584-Alexandrium_andersonii.AAC.1